jgi:hypothetical protein
LIAIETPECRVAKIIPGTYAKARPPAFANSGERWFFLKIVLRWPNQEIIVA